MTAIVSERPQVAASPRGPALELALVSPHTSATLDTFRSETLVDRLEHVLELEIMPHIPQVHLSQIDEWHPVVLMQLIEVALSRLRNLLTVIGGGPLEKPSRELTTEDYARPREHYTQNDIDMVRFKDGGAGDTHLDTSRPEYSLLQELEGFRRFVVNGFQHAAHLRNLAVTPPVLELASTPLGPSIFYDLSQDSTQPGRGNTEPLVLPADPVGAETEETPDDEAEA